MDSISSCPEFWNPKQAAKMIQLLLLYDLNDSACAYAEKFFREKTISKSEFEKLLYLIQRWTKSLEFLYEKT